MGILNNPLGINLTTHMPLIHSVFNDSDDEGTVPVPPGSFRMITEGGIFMITEITLDHMITE